MGSVRRIIEDFHRNTLKGKIKRVQAFFDRHQIVSGILIYLSFRLFGFFIWDFEVSAFRMLGLVAMILYWREKERRR